jgi:hypothetical protein
MQTRMLTSCPWNDSLTPQPGPKRVRLPLPRVNCLSFSCLALLFAGAVVPAHAAALFYVITDSLSVTTDNVATEGTVERTYNTLAGSNLSIANFGATLTNDGSPNVLGLTSSFDQTSAATGAFSAASFAAADLSTGLLRASVSNVGNGPHGGAQAVFSDTLTFTIPGATDSTITDVGIHYVVHGLFDTDRGSVDLPLLFGSAEVDPQWFSIQAPSFHSNFGWASETVNQLDTQNFDFTGFIAVTGANPVVQFSAAINLDCSGIVSCNTDFSHTGAVTLNLPSGVTFSSASGVFLTAAPQAGVPEPTTLVLFGLGLAGIGLARRKRTAS